MFILLKPVPLLSTFSRIWGCVIFGSKNTQFALNKILLVQTIIITFIYLLALFIVQNLKKFLQRIQSSKDVRYLDPK